MATWVKRPPMPICFKYFACDFPRSRWKLFPNCVRMKSGRGLPFNSWFWGSYAGPNFSAPKYWTRETAEGQDPMSICRDAFVKDKPVVGQFVWLFGRTATRRGE